MLKYLLDTNIVIYTMKNQQKTPLCALRLPRLSERSGDPDPSGPARPLLLLFHRGSFGKWYWGSSPQKNRDKAPLK